MTWGTKMDAELLAYENLPMEELKAELSVVEEWVEYMKKPVFNNEFEELGRTIRVGTGFLRVNKLKSEIRKRYNEKISH